MLFGEFFHNIDQKGRMNFPSRMRDELGERFVVTLWSDNCLAVFSETEWDRICDRIRQLPIAKASKIQHYIFPNACYLEPDKQGRILLPQNLRDSAALGKDVAVIGMMDRAEIWDRDRWIENKRNFNSKSFEEHLEENGI